jgi:hypothetical protein
VVLGLLAYFSRGRRELIEYINIDQAPAQPSLDLPIEQAIRGVQGRAGPISSRLDR